MRTPHVSIVHFGRGLLALILGTALVLAACDTESRQAEAPAPTPPAAQNATQRPIGDTASGAALSGAITTPSLPAAHAGPVTEISITALDNSYTPSDFRIRAGDVVRVTVENQGQAIHDWRVRGLPDDTGRDTGTGLLRTGDVEEFALSVEQPGEYVYYCEVHPVDMRGVLSVE